MKTNAILFIPVLAMSLAPSLLAENTPGILAPEPAAKALLAPRMGIPGNAWKISLAPLIASQVLDMSSSWGMRELNPALASADGTFGMKAASMKIGATAAMVGVEYLLVKKYPKSARILTKMNWS